MLKAGWFAAIFPGFGCTGPGLPPGFPPGFPPGCLPGFPLGRFGGFPGFGVGGLLAVGVVGGKLLMIVWLVVAANGLFRVVGVLGFASVCVAELVGVFDLAP